MLLQHLQPGDRTVAFIGVAKNVGKTTAMNALIDELDDARVPFGVLSVGIDGEATDAISGRDKPAIFVPSGTLVATTDRMLEHCGLAADIVALTGIVTPLGEVVLARARRAGNVILAGLRHKADVQALARQMRQHAAERVLIDGAFDRIAAADPATCDAIIVSTGLAVGGGVDRCVARTHALLTRFLLPRHHAPAFDAVCVDEAWAPLDGWRRWRPGPDDRVQALAVTGLIGDDALEHLSERLPLGGLLVARDPTRVMASDRALRRFMGRRRLAVAARAPVRALTVSPFDGQGVLPVAERHSLLAALAALPLPSLPPVLDVVAHTCHPPVERA